MLPVTVQNVLLVDDREENLLAMQATLAAEDRNLLLARSGNEALAEALEHDLALILLDVMMPDMDGYEVAELLRGHEKTRLIPIIFVTAINRDKKHLFRGYAAGAIDYIFKPVDPTILASKVSVFCELKRYEVQQQLLLDSLEKSNKQLAELDQLKTDFLAAAGHELRTPLTVVRESVSLVFDEVTGAVNNDQKQCLESALRNCDRLGGLVNDLLDLQNLKSGHMNLQLQIVDPYELLERCYQEFLQRYGTNNQSLYLDLAEQLPQISCDPSGIRQVLASLVDNAHKFSAEESQITISAEYKNERVVIRVYDDGPGIAVADQQKIFQSFTQLNRTDAAGCQGTGVGLSICRHIIATHGGKLIVKSETGQGAQFAFDLPAQINTDKNPQDVSRNLVTL